LKSGSWFQLGLGDNIVHSGLLTQRRLTREWTMCSFCATTRYFQYVVLWRVAAEVQIFFWVQYHVMSINTKIGYAVPDVNVEVSGWFW